MNMVGTFIRSLYQERDFTFVWTINFSTELQKLFGNLCMSLSTGPEEGTRWIYEGLSFTMLWARTVVEQEIHSLQPSNPARCFQQIFLMFSCIGQ